MRDIYPRILPVGDMAVMVEFGNEIREDINESVRSFQKALQEINIYGIIETVPAYRSLTVYYNPLVICYQDLTSRLHTVHEKMQDTIIDEREVLDIPVLYGGEEGPDLAYVAEYNGLSPQEVIHIHTSRDYPIYMLGFAPGFAYLGGLDKKIATPRLKTPRISIPAGSVGIAETQTGIYPISTPGGWQLIGRTPVMMYNYRRSNPILPHAGQAIRFRSIGRREYEEITELEASDKYIVNILSQGRRK